MGGMSGHFSHSSNVLELRILPIPPSDAVPSHVSPASAGHSLSSISALNISYQTFKQQHALADSLASDLRSCFLFSCLPSACCGLDFSLEWTKSISCMSAPRCPEHLISSLEGIDAT